ncbi:MAG: ATP-binding protein [Actinomycetota bacterium]|nr:ATP-binding protein [Actinomycetota bacterium]
MLAVASCKGGTGKTLVATNMSVLASAHLARVVLVDCDVEAPNDHLFLSSAEVSATPVEVLVAQVDTSRCTACGRCRDACAYGAVRLLGGSAIVFEELCHGCGVCSDVCPQDAVREAPCRVGEVVVGPVIGRDRLVLVTGRLDVGQVKSPSVIRSARSAARAIAADLVVLDAPPGVACSAVAAVRGADALLLVAEPTPFGLHDLELSLRLGRELRLPMGILVNRDVGAGDEIEYLCRAWDVPILARIPFDRQVAETYARGELIIDTLPTVSQILAALPEAMRALAPHEVVVR